MGITVEVNCNTHFAPLELKILEDAFLYTFRPVGALFFGDTCFYTDASLRGLEIKQKSYENPRNLCNPINPRFRQA